VTNITETVFEECDPELAELSIPAELKILEGVLKNDPENKQILTSLCMGFTGYSMLFIEEKDTERASGLYLRARNYGLRALYNKTPLLNAVNVRKELIVKILENMDSSDIDALFWTTMSWNAWINLNLDKPSALSQLGIAELCLKKMIKIRPDYLYGSPYILMGTILAAKPKMLGGNATASRKYFDMAMDLSKGKFLLVHYFYAKHYAVRAQDKTLFIKLITQAKNFSPDINKDVCLINAVMKKRILQLKENMDELFF
jgi:hypothetical protein